MLSRTSGRRREIAIRAALGASRFRLARQLFAESLLLAVAGGLTGLLLAAWGVDALRALAPGDIPRLAQSGLTRAVGVFGFVATIVTVILFGTAPVMRLGDFQQSEGLRESSRAHSAGREQAVSRRPGNFSNCDGVAAFDGRVSIDPQFRFPHACGPRLPSGQCTGI